MAFLLPLFRCFDKLSVLKGFGFVTFDSPDEADNAKEKVNGSIIDGRKIEARAKVLDFCMKMKYQLCFSGQ